MLRWTSAVPPPTVSAGANRKPRDQVGSAGVGAAGVGAAGVGAAGVGSAGVGAAAVDRGEVPDGPQRPTGPVPVSMGVWTGQVPRHIHDVLAMGVGDGLADRGLRPRSPPRQDG